MRRRAAASRPGARDGVFDAPRYWDLPFEDGARVLVDVYGESDEQARLIMAMHHDLLPGDAVAVDEQEYRRRRTRPNGQSVSAGR